MSRILKGLPAQLLLITILPLTLVLSIVAFGGVYMHHQAMRTLVSERDMRAVMATSEMMQRAIGQRPDGSLDLTPEQFNRLINPMAEYRPVTAFLFDRSGTVLLHTEMSYAGQNVMDHGGVTEALRGEHGVTYVTDSGQTAEHVVSYAPITLAGTRYGLVIEESWQEVVDPLMTYSLVAPLVLLPVLVLVVIGLVLGVRRIVQPLQQLQRQARSASAGNLAALTQPVEGIEEIADLQATLTAMSQRIQTDQERLRHYAHAITNAQEQERKRLAHDLHDDTIQSLIALSQRIQVARIAARKGIMIDESRLDGLRGDVLTMIEDVRRFTRALRPIYLEEAGLVAALERMAAEANERGAVHEPLYTVSFACTGQVTRLQPETELTLFRISQEALNNAVKHSHASCITVKIGISVDAEHSLSLTIHDNGDGYAVDASHAGLGLLGIRERAASIGARLSLNSTLQKGSTVQVVISSEDTHKLNY